MKRMLMRSGVRLTLAVLSTMTLIACGATRATVMRASSACIAFQPITFSARNDTPETIGQVRGHNAAWDSICGEKP